MFISVLKYSINAMTTDQSRVIIYSTYCSFVSEIKKNWEQVWENVLYETDVDKI
jgi:bifunctional pyridoxal-dependent enzyme with beta-cystathionase and maltose regulon repressor activities